MSNINICAQDAYLALYPQSKKPVGVNWPDEGTSQEQALATNGNLGLLLGPKSDVMDVDLDCREAKGLAELIYVLTTGLSSQLKCFKSGLPR